jgi:hypothetical protein
MGHNNFVDTLYRPLVKQHRSEISTQPRIWLQLTPDSRKRKFDPTASQAELEVSYQGR